jgi:hypothetical protein
MKQNNETVWKELLDGMLDDLLRFVFPDIEGRIDLQKGFEGMDVKFSSTEPDGATIQKPGLVYKLFRRKKRPGSVKPILFYVAIQEGFDADFPKKMYRNYNQLCADYKLPVFSLAIMIGPDSEKIPDQYSKKDAFTELTFRYPVLRISSFTDDELQKSDNPISIAFMAVRLNEDMQSPSPKKKEGFERFFRIVDMVESMQGRFPLRG